MQKRRFLGATMVAAVATGSMRPASAAQTGSPPLLTVSGLIGAGNRGPFDPALDQLMAKQKLAFSKAHTFDFAVLTSLPPTTIRPTLTYAVAAAAIRRQLPNERLLLKPANSRSRPKPEIAIQRLMEGSGVGGATNAG